MRLETSCFCIDGVSRRTSLRSTHTKRHPTPTSRSILLDGKDIRSTNTWKDPHSDFTRVTMPTSGRGAFRHARIMATRSSFAGAASTKPNFEGGSWNSSSGQQTNERARIQLQNKQKRSLHKLRPRTLARKIQHKGTKQNVGGHKKHGGGLRQVPKFDVVHDPSIKPHGCTIYRCRHLPPPSKLNSSNSPSNSHSVLLYLKTRSSSSTWWRGFIAKTGWSAYEGG